MRPYLKINSGAEFDLEHSVMSVNKSILIEFWALNAGEHGDKQKKQSLIQNRPEIFNLNTNKFTYQYNQK